MMEKGKINIVSSEKEEESLTDRQERIPWWQQKAVNDARILVAGAGAIGNEVLKNLALIGFGHVMICDMDEISASNLSRTVLFTKDDVGKKKAEVAAERYKQMCVCPDTEVTYFVGNIVSELGTGVFGQFDIVLGCLDNYECRLSVNRRCNELGIPYIDGGIWELSWSVQVFHYPHSSCFACGVSSKMVAEERKRRYSCAAKKIRLVQERKASTIEVAAASAAALMVQEAAKIVNGQEVVFGRKYHFEGLSNMFQTVRVPVKKDCMYHSRFESITKTAFTNQVTLREFLSGVSAAHDGKRFYIDILGDYTFMTDAECRSCGKKISVFQPDYKMYMEDFYCDACKAEQKVSDGLELKCEELVALDASDLRVADMTLAQLGIPKAHIVTVRNVENDEECYHYELTADLPEMLGSIAVRK